jgi:hypothetical protein
VVLGVLRIRKWREWQMSERERDAVLFATVFLVVGVIADLLFLRALSYYMQPWYFLVLLLIVGVGTDLVLGCAGSGKRTRIIRLVTSSLIAAATLPNLWNLTHERRTNVDIVASIIRNNAHAGDVVVVSPWYVGTSFQRYYSGPPEWFGVPPLKFVRFQRYDLLLEHMMAPTQALLPVFERMQKVLSSGRRVWVVGELSPAREPMFPLIPAPNGPSGWHDAYYNAAWTMRIHRFFQEHALRAQVIQTEEAGPVSQYERLPIIMIEGWRQ